MIKHLSRVRGGAACIPRQRNPCIAVLDTFVSVKRLESVHNMVHLHFSELCEGGDGR